MISQTYSKAQITKIVQRETRAIEKRDNPRAHDRRELKKTIRVLFISTAVLLSGFILRYTLFRLPFEVAPWQPLLFSQSHTSSDVNTTEVSAKGSAELADKHFLVHPKS